MNNQGGPGTERSVNGADRLAKEAKSGQVTPVMALLTSSSTDSRPLVAT